MGTQKTEKTTTVPQAGAGENALQRLLQSVASGAAGQLGDLSGLAGGDLSALGVTGADRALVQESFGATTDMAKRALEELSTTNQAKLGETLASLGQTGGSNEGLQRMLSQLGLERGAQDLISQQTVSGNQFLANLPFQRAQTQLSANQALFNRLTGTATPALQALLQNRLAQPTMTQESPMFTGADIANFAKSAVSKIGGGGGGTQ